VRYESGQSVHLLSATGVIERTVVRDLGDILLVCLPREFEAAARESREPVAVGFRHEYVIPAQAKP
jgi:hypothetical protein